MPGVKKENIQIVSVQPRDFYITIDIRFRSAKMIRDALDGATMTHVSEEANDAIKEFFSKLDMVVEECEKDGIGRDST